MLFLLQGCLRPVKRAPTDPLSLRLIKPLPVNIAAEADVVLIVNPIKIHHVLVLRILPVIRHEVDAITDFSEIAGVAFVELKFGPAGLKFARAGLSAQH